MGSIGEMPGNHALIYGATGIQGWAIASQLLKGYPTEDSFGKITALTNRPLSEGVLWPESKKFQVVSGLDLLNKGGQEALEKDMKERIAGIETVSHVFFGGIHIRIAWPRHELTTTQPISSKSPHKRKSTSTSSSSSAPSQPSRTSPNP